MKMIIKSVTFNPYTASTSTKNDELGILISKCYTDVFNPFSFNIDANIEMKYISPIYESNNLSIISY